MIAADRDRIARRIVGTSFQINALLLREGNRLADRAGLTQQQWVLLAALPPDGAGTGVPLSSLGRNLLVTKANVTGMVDRLERLGLVRRVRDGADRRVVRANLTSRGAALLKRLAPDQRAWGRATYGAMGDGDLAALDEALRRHRDLLMGRARARNGTRNGEGT